MSTIYLDYNATTPIDPGVAKEMKPYLDALFGNPSSIHEFGIKTKLAVENSRRQIADFLGCNPDEVIFTSGGTESNNHAVKGMAYALQSKGNHIITSSIEHPSIIEVCHHLEKKGFTVTYLPVDEWGRVSPEELENAITLQTILVTIMHANNEVGTLQPISEISAITRKHGIVLHTDAAQSCGKIPVRVDDLGVDLLSVAGHKLYGPKGIGVLYIRRGIKPEKLIHGADHEMNFRAGTENVMEIAGLGKACELASRFSPLASRRQCDILFQGILEEIPEIKLNGHPEDRLPNTLSIGFPGVDATRLLAEMKGVAASAGAACHSDRTDVSAVLTAMGVPLNYAMGTIRFSLGRMTSDQEIQQAIPIITEAYMRITGTRLSALGSRFSESSIKLTQYTHSLGCACKIRPQLLQKILKGIPLSDNPNVLVDLRNSDDAAVYKLDEKTAIVQTVDFIPPVVDDPYSFGAISAANSLSDIYAMGGKPLFALSIVAFPDKLLPVEVLTEILRGANDKVMEAGISIIGGHTIEDTEPKFGLVVTGTIDPSRIITNSNAKPGDAIILTKPVGTGILSTGIKRGLVSRQNETSMIGMMSSLNRKAAEIMLTYPVNACTDVTGFGLLGHLSEMVKGSNVNADIFAGKVPVMKGVMELVTGNVIPGGTKNNLQFVEDLVTWDPSVSEAEKMILADAQTSGGLMISIPSGKSEQFLKELHTNGMNEAVIIGKFTNEGNKIIVTGEKPG